MALAPLTPHIANVEEFLSHCHRRRYPSKSTIIYAGDQGDTLYYIIKGSVTVMIEDDSDGKEIILAYLNPGDFFGEIGVLMATPRTASVRAKTLCDLFVLTKADFSRILHDHPQFAASMMQVAKERYDLAVSMGDLMAAGPVT